MNRRETENDNPLSSANDHWTGDPVFDSVMIGGRGYEALLRGKPGTAAETHQPPHEAHPSGETLQGSKPRRRTLLTFIFGGYEGKISEDYGIPFLTRKGAEKTMSPGREITFIPGAVFRRHEKPSSQNQQPQARR